MAQKGYRSKDSYASKNPIKRQNQLAGGSKYESFSNAFSGFDPDDSTLG